MNETELKEIWTKAYALAPDAIRPCVCSDKIPKSSKSVITSPYKIPTILNNKGEYVGIKSWQHPKDIVGPYIDIYANNPVYGILLLCKDYFIIDIDIEDDILVKSIHTLLPTTYYRYRCNSSRRAYIYKKDFALKKNIITTNKGCVEFLGDSQVCQIGGLHKTGFMVKWHPAFPNKDDIPLITKENFLSLYSSLSKHLTGSTGQPILSNPYVNKTKTLKYKDAETIAVYNSKYYIDTDEDGKLFVKCPCEEQHTSLTNKTDACYFPKGYQDNVKSGFHCFHASHGNITVKDFLSSIGYKSDTLACEDFNQNSYLKQQIEAIQNSYQKTKQQQISEILELLKPYLDIKYNKNRNRYEILRSLDNYLLLFEYFPPNLYYDKFTNKIHYNDEPPCDSYDISLEWDYSQQFSFASCSNRTGIRAAIKKYLKNSQKDSLKEYFNKLKWDGVRRIKSFHVDCLNQSRDNFASKAYMYYLFTALAARGLGDSPVQADMILTLCGNQGIGKTTFVRLLNPNDVWYRSLNMFTSKEEKTRTSQGFFAIELAEISHLNERIENEIKDFVTQTKDTWRPLYSDISLTKNRRFVLIGTSNHIHFLNDSTGNRRWLPLHLKKPINTDYLKQNRDQLYAEAVEIYKTKGLQYEKASLYAAKEEYKYLIRDRWTFYVEKYIKENNNLSILHVENLLENVIGVKVSDMDSYKHQARMHRVLKSLQYTQSEDNPNQFERIDV